jgi:type I restriction enzyme S subunit
VSTPPAGLTSRWRTLRLKYCVRQIDDKVEGTGAQIYVGLENIESWTGRYLNNETESRGDGTSIRFASGDVLFGKLRPYLAKCLRAEWDGACTSELLVLRPRHLESRYLQFLMLSRDWIEVVNSSTYGAKMPRANWDFIGNLRVPVPEPNAQRAIANFLERETARIDELVARKERLIHLLNEKLSATITDAVTTSDHHGGAVFRASRADWLAHVPSHWKDMILACATDRIGNGYVGPTRDILTTDETNSVRYIQSLHIKNGRIQFRQPYFVDANWARSNPKSRVSQGDVLIVQTGAGTGGVAVVDQEFDGCHCHALIIVKLKSNLATGRYVNYFLRSSYGRQILESIRTGAMHPHLECSKVREVRLLLPPIAEQRQIVDKLDRIEALVTGARQKMQSCVSTLNVYRTALISAAVTGQIDVRTYRKEPEAVLEPTA